MSTIEHLLIWVHPSWVNVGCMEGYDAMLQSWCDLIEALPDHPEYALVQTNNNAFRRPYDPKDRLAILDDLDDAEQFDAFTFHLDDIAELDHLARLNFPDRFMQWPYLHVDCNDGQDVAGRMMRHFGVHPRVFPGFDEPRLFRSIDVFGVHPLGCVTYQTQDSNLRQIACNVSSCGEFAPVLEYLYV